MQKWIVNLDGGPRRVNHAAVPICEKIYTFGGYCTGGDYETRLPMDVHVLDTISLRWKLIPQLETREEFVPYQRYGHSAVSVDECAYIWGGRNDSDGACNILFMYDTATCKWCRVHTLGTTPGARDGHSACVINNKMYIFGGYEETIDRFSDDIYTYDFRTNTWTFVKTKGHPGRWRDFHTAIGIDDIMYIFGGRGDLGGDTFTNREIYCNKIQIYNTVTHTWHEPVTHGTTPSGRRSHSVFTYKGCLYIFGGYNGKLDKHYKDIYKFDPRTNTWSEVKVQGEGPCSRRRQCCCMINCRVFLFGGTSPTENMDSAEGESALVDLSDLHILDLEPSLKTLSQLVVIKYELDVSCLPRDLGWEIAAMTTPNVITRPNSHG